MRNSAVPASQNWVAPWVWQFDTAVIVGWVCCCCDDVTWACGALCCSTGVRVAEATSKSGVASSPQRTDALMVGFDQVMALQVRVSTEVLQGKWWAREQKKERSLAEQDNLGGWRWRRGGVAILNYWRIPGRYTSRPALGEMCSERKSCAVGKALRVPEGVAGAGAMVSGQVCWIAAADGY